jgi:hypothetical protein
MVIESIAHSILFLIILIYDRGLALH